MTPPEVEICSRCHDHTTFEEEDGEWLSVCCGAPPIKVDVEPPDPLEPHCNQPDCYKPAFPF